MSERDTMIDTVRQELPALPSGEDGQDRLIGPDNPNYLPMIEAIADVRLRTQAERVKQPIEDQLRTEYLAIMRECREGTATTVRVRRGLYLVMRLAARTYFMIDE